MKLSVVVLTYNAEKHLPDCLASVKDLADEIVLFDGGSTDKTLAIAQEYNARIIKQVGKSYDQWRNQGRKEVAGEWILYLDPDERATPLLRKEIETVVKAGSGAIRRRVTRAGEPQGRGPVLASRRNGLGAGERQDSSSAAVAFAIPRRNFVFGKELRHGGWYPDYVIRLFKKENLVKWRGELHEQPEVNGETGYLKEPLIHLKETSLSAMVEKTNSWSEIEARLLFEAGHPKMSWWRFFRVPLTEVFDRLILKLGFLDGAEGFIFSIYQGFSKFVTYTKLWELQQKRLK